MKYWNIKVLRESISVFTKKSTKYAVGILVVDYMIYIGALAGVILLDNIFLKLLCGILVGLKMASLFVIAHDAAHDNYTNSKLLNKIIGRMAFMPCYHNYSLWLIVHNRLHHQFTNIKNVNSWSPMSRNEYISLPAWRRLLERFYRCPFGISFNYLIERWWKNKFFPFDSLIKKPDHCYWYDFILVTTYLLTQLSLLVYVGTVSPDNTVFGLILTGFVIPLFIFSFMVGFSVYQQHTHESVPWFETKEEQIKYTNIEDLTVHVKYPNWYNIVSHNVMEHTAHHIDPRIPSYNLGKAQSELNRLMGDDLISIKFNLHNFLMTMRCCKLYDYENHQWLDFEGKVTCRIKLEYEYEHFANAA